MNACAVVFQPLRGELRNGVPMHKHTVWACGGPADRLYSPADLDDLSHFLAQCDPAEPLFWLGLGSNLLVRDGGLRGTVVALSGALDDIVRDGTRLNILAGTPCAKVARFCAREQLAGASFFAGIPGTMGGALAMNAGAFGGVTWPLVNAVQTIDRKGVLRRRPASDYTIGYRSVAGPDDEWFVGCELVLAQAEATDAVDARAQIKSLLATRAATQPTGQRSCGSVFRNPPGDYAGRLIEAAGLKGLRIGGALVSPEHANFIINVENATAAEIEQLINHVQLQVRQQFGVQLAPEVHIIGDAA